VRRVLLLLPVVFAAVAATAIACSDNDEPAPTSTAVLTPAPLAISLQDNMFVPATLTARAGQQLQIDVKNDGQRGHTFTVEGTVDTGRLEPGASKSVQFTPAQAGTLQYFCMVHGKDRMFGTLTVSASVMSEPAEPTDVTLEASAAGN